MKNSSTRGMAAKKGVASFLALLSFTAYMPVSCIPAFANIAADTLPDLNKAVNGSVSTDTATTTMNVSVNGGKGTVGQFDWNTFNVGKDATVNWVFNANNQTALNRVLASGGMSYIYGKLTETAGTGCPACVNTSKVILINPSGILMGNGSQVNLNSFTASTFDIKGAKDLSKLSADQLKDYAATGGTTGTLFDIAGYNKTVQFVANDNMVNGDGYIKTDGTGTRLASIVAEKSTIKADKTIAMVGNKIEIKDSSSLLTKYNSENPNASNAKQNRSNIKLVTGDGVNFFYTSAGDITNNATVVKATKTQNQEYGVKISDSAVRSGNIEIYNGVDKDKSSIEISGSKVYTKKLLGADYPDGSYKAEETGTDGELYILSKGDITIKDSDIQTTNEDKSGVKTTTGIGYGNLGIVAKDDVTIKNSQIRSADSKLNADKDSINAGNIVITSEEGNVNLIKDAPTDSPYYNNTAIAAGGDAFILAKQDVNIQGYDKIQAKGHGTANQSSSFTDRTINIASVDKNVSVDSALLNAKNVNIAAAAKIDVKDSSVVGDNTKMLAADTTIDNSLLQYNDLKFTGEGVVNNVTIKDGTTLRDKDSDKLVVSTNGNLTIQNNMLQKKSYSATTSTTATDQKEIELESTNGNVTLTGKTDILTTNGGITVKANNGSITVNNSRTYANGETNMTAKNNINVGNTSQVWSKDGNVNLTSNNGKVLVKNSKVAAEGGNTTIDQKSAMNIGSDYANSMVGATGKLTLKADGNIVDTGKMASGTGYINDYKDLTSLNDTDNNIKFIFAGDKGVELNAGGDIKLDNVSTAKHVDLVAGKNIDVKGASIMELTDVSTSANGTASIAAAGRLTTDGFDALKGTKTTLSGTTVNTKDGSVIDAHSNKLAVNSTGAIDIAVKGVNNTNQGLEINADVNTSAGSAPLAGRTVSVEAKDGTLAISKIKADTLDLYANTIKAAKTTISSANDNINGEGGLAKSGADISSKGYIEVKTEGGFNLDATKDYNASNANMYGSNYNSVVTSKTKENEKVKNETEKKFVTTYEEEVITSTRDVKDTNNIVSGPTTEKVNVKVDVSEPQRQDNVVQDGKTGYTETTITTTTWDEVTTTVYGSKVEETGTAAKTINTEQGRTKTTTTWDDVTKTREDQHIATVGDQKNDFVLVYGKTKTDTKANSNVSYSDWKNTGVVNTTGGGAFTRLTDKTGTKTFTDTDTKTGFKKIDEDTTFCEYEDELPVVTPLSLSNDIASTVKNPRHAEGISNLARVRNDLADTTSTVVAAAARLQLDDEDGDSQYNADEEEDFNE